MNIFEALINDHNKIKELLIELVSLQDDDTDARDDLVAEIHEELIPHSRAEESVFYNSLRSMDEEKDVVAHSYKEHMIAEAHLRVLQIKDKLGMDWKKTAYALKEALEHHIHEEETKVFDAARKALTQQEANELGTLFEKIKPQIQDEGFMKSSYELIKNLIPPRFSNAFKNMGSHL